jgi:hypothetical protein
MRNVFACHQCTGEVVDFARLPAMRPKCEGVEAARLPAGVSACCWIDLEREKCALRPPNLLHNWNFLAKVVDSVMSTSSFPLVNSANAITRKQESDCGRNPGCQNNHSPPHNRSYPCNNMLLRTKANKVRHDVQMSRTPTGIWLVTYMPDRIVCFGTAWSNGQAGYVRGPLTFALAGDGYQVTAIVISGPSIVIQKIHETH